MDAQTLINNGGTMWCPLSGRADSSPAVEAYYSLNVAYSRKWYYYTSESSFFTYRCDVSHMLWGKNREDECPGFNRIIRKRPA